MQDNLKKTPYDLLFIFVVEEGGEELEPFTYKEKQVLTLEFFRILRGEFFTEQEFNEFLEESILKLKIN